MPFPKDYSSSAELTPRPCPLRIIRSTLKVAEIGLQLHRHENTFPARTEMRRCSTPSDGSMPSVPPSVYLVVNIDTAIIHEFDPGDKVHHPS